MLCCSYKNLTIFFVNGLPTTFNLQRIARNYIEFNTSCNIHSLILYINHNIELATEALQYIPQQKIVKNSKIGSTAATSTSTISTISPKTYSTIPTTSKTSTYTTYTKSPTFVKRDLHCFNWDGQHSKNPELFKKNYAEYKARITKPTVNMLSSSSTITSEPSIANRHMEVTITNHNIIVPALLDTGADINIINSELADTIVSQGGKFIHEPTTIQLADKSMQEIQHWIELIVSVKRGDTSHYFTVKLAVMNSTEKLIIGRNIAVVQ